MAEKKNEYVEFYLEALPDVKRTREEGRPIFREEVMVCVKFVGDPQNTLIAKAHEKFQMNRSSDTGAHITYAERWPEHYKAFLANNQAALEGTPLEHLPFLNKSQIAEFKAQNIRTAEGLAGVPDRVLTNRMGWRMLREQTKVWIEETDKMALVTKANAERDDLQARLEKLEALLEQKTSPDAAPVVDDVGSWDESKLREFLTDRGITPRANASRDKLATAVRDLMADA